MSDRQMKLSRANDEPDFVNPEGVKWWAVGPMWMVELPSGEREYVAVADCEVKYASQQFEAVAIWQELERRTRQCA